MPICAQNALRMPQRTLNVIRTSSLRAPDGITLDSQGWSQRSQDCGVQRGGVRSILKTSKIFCDTSQICTVRTRESKCLGGSLRPRFPLDPPSPQRVDPRRPPLRGTHRTHELTTLTPKAIRRHLSLFSNPVSFSKKRVFQLSLHLMATSLTKSDNGLDHFLKPTNLASC